MKKLLKTSLTLAALVAAAALHAAAPAGIDGKWSGMVGQSAITFTFKTEGGKVTGTLDNAAQPGSTELKDVKLEGDSVSFHVVRNLNNAETKVQWTGKLAGDELKLQRGEVAGNPVADVVATRVKE
jgi:hypothetical protein